MKLYTHDGLQGIFFSMDVKLDENRTLYHFSLSNTNVKDTDCVGTCLTFFITLIFAAFLLSSH